ncbi:contractile injection system tape measure protein [Chitinophaga sp.]|uniref:contractile injection system tape measure protein n=1 Tax=Chitinophaga sp. TaxID=1869181 RepID=UPI0031D8FCB2
MEVGNSALSQQEQHNSLYPGPEQEPQWGLCSVNEIYQYAWFFFMQHGLIPWWMQQETPASLEENIIAAVQQQPALYRTRWFQAWAGNRLCIPRWVLQCSPTLRQTALCAVFGAAAGEAAAAGESSLLQRFASWPVVPYRLRCLYWDALFTTLMATERTNLKDKIREKWNKWMQTAISIAGSSLLDEITFPDVLHGLVAPAIHTSTVDAVTAPDLGLDEPLLAKQAGLVLLHAQLARLLKEVQWLLPGGTGILPERYSSAVHLLAFMAGEEEAVPEYNMALHKLLCGIPLHEPVEKDVQLTEQEKQAALALVDELAAACHLNRQSFRSTVLQRNGKLQFNGVEWMLTVAAETVAPCLAVKETAGQPLQLPWMQHPVSVQWTT